MIKKSKKKILITGASGFIGKNLKEYLQKKYSVLTPTHKELDLLDTEQVSSFLKSKKIDVVINCAVIGGSRKEERVADAFLQNAKIFFNFIKNQKYFKKMIHFGSGAEYDKSRPLIRIKEESFGDRIPQDEYGFFKYVCSKYIEKSERIVNLRIFGLFGKYENYKLRFISNAIYRNLKGLPITMRQNVYFDYVYIDDFVKIVEYFINHNPNSKFYNIGTGKRISLIEVANKLNNIAKKKSRIIIKEKGLNNEYSCDNTRLMKELGQFTFEDFDVSLKKLYYWYKKNG